jgi:hypothetical protein
VVEEGTDQRRVQVAEVKLAGLLAGLALREAQQQPQRVAVGGHGARAGVSLGDEPVCEERLWRPLHRRFYPNTQTMRSWDKKSPQIGMLSVAGST